MYKKSKDKHRFQPMNRKFLISDFNYFCVFFFGNSGPYTYAYTHIGTISDIQLSQFFFFFKFSFIVIITSTNRFDRMYKCHIIIIIAYRWVIYITHCVRYTKGTEKRRKEKHWKLRTILIQFKIVVLVVNTYLCVCVPRGLYCVVLCYAMLWYALLCTVYSVQSTIIVLFAWCTFTIIICVDWFYFIFLFFSFLFVSFRLFFQFYFHFILSCSGSCSCANHAISSW